MTLYHGGLTAVMAPRIIHAERVGDFGVGFYTTTDVDQARRFVMRKCAVAGVDRGTVSVYSVPVEIFTDTALKVLRFDGPTDAWVEFVFANRRIPSYEHENDLVYGPVADDQVYASLALFEDGQIGYDELIRRLRTRRLVDQLLFHTARSLKSLRYVASLEVLCTVK